MESIPGLQPMSDPQENTTHSLGTVTRVTGLSADLLRAWERRYQAVQPLRTAGGTRRYRDADVERLRLLKSAVDRGLRIGRVAHLSDSELIDRVSDPRSERPATLDRALEAVMDLHGRQLESIARDELSRLGPAGFAKDFALPLLEAVGASWVTREVTIAGEHLATSLMRSLLGASLSSMDAVDRSPHIVFATPEGEAHEFGCLAAAVVASSTGAQVTYLGSELPENEMARAVEMVGAHVLSVGITYLPLERARESLKRLDKAIPEGVEIWLGGIRSAELAGGRIRSLTNMEDLEIAVTEHQAFSGRP